MVAVVVENVDAEVNVVRVYSEFRFRCAVTVFCVDLFRSASAGDEADSVRGRCRYIHKSVFYAERLYLRTCGAVESAFLESLCNSVVLEALGKNRNPSAAAVASGFSAVSLAPCVVVVGCNAENLLALSEQILIAVAVVRRSRPLRSRCCISPSRAFHRSRSIRDSSRVTMSGGCTLRRIRCRVRLS